MYWRIKNNPNTGVMVGRIWTAKVLIMWRLEDMIYKPAIVISKGTIDVLRNIAKSAFRPGKLYFAKA
jgi:hypothetical protein